MLTFWVHSLRPWRWPIYGGFALLLLQLILSLSLIPVSQNLGAVLQNFNDSYFLQLLALICILFWSKNGLEYWSSVNLAFISSAWMIQLRTRVFAHLIQADWNSLQTFDPEDLLARLSDDLEKLRTAMQFALHRLLPNAILLFCLLGALFYLSWLLSLLIFIALPVFIWLLRRLGSSLHSQANALQTLVSQSYQELSEALQQLVLIRLYRQESTQIQRLQALQLNWQQHYLKVSRRQFLERPLLGSLQILLIAGILAFSTYLVVNQHLKTEALLAYATAVALAIDPVLWIGEAWGHIHVAQASWSRLSTLLELPVATKKDLQSSPDSSLRIQTICFDLPERPILSQIDQVILPGQWIGLSGASGAGKSSLLRILAGFETNYSGHVLWPPGWTAEDQAVILVPQRSTLFNRTLRENLCLDWQGADQELDQVLAICGLTERIQQLEQGLDTPLGPRGSFLSGGEIQRLALARALLRQPQLLLLDESTSELNPDLEFDILQAIRQAYPKISCLCVSHRPSTLHQMDRLWHLEHSQCLEIKKAAS